MHHPFVIYFAFATRIFINTFASARSQRRSDLDQAEVESNVEGKPHLKRSGENTVRKERLPRSIRNGDNFSSFFFRPDVLSAFCLLLWIWQRAAATCSPLDLYTPPSAGSVIQSYACGFVVIMLATRGYIIALCPCRAAARPPFYTWYYFITEDSQRWYYHITWIVSTNRGYLVIQNVRYHHAPRFRIIFLSFFLYSHAIKFVLA